MEEKTIINKFENDNCDSVELGTPSKGGAVKIYGNFNDLVAFKKKIDAAREIREYAQAQIMVTV